MPSAKDTVYTDLVDAVESVVSLCFEDTRVVEIGQDNWYPDVQLRQDTVMIYETQSDAVIEVSAEGAADMTEIIGGDTRYYKHVPDVRPTLEEELGAREFVTESYTDRETGQGRLRVFGWDHDPPWFQAGDYMKVYRWRTPLEVVHVCPPGQAPQDDRALPVTGDGTYIGADSLHLYLRGNRGGEYLIDYDDDDVASLYQRETGTSETLQKSTEPGKTIFVGNPETGPRHGERIFE